MDYNFGLGSDWHAYKAQRDQDKKVAIVYILHTIKLNSHAIVFS